VSSLERLTHYLTHERPAASRNGEMEQQARGTKRQRWCGAELLVLCWVFSAVSRGID